MAWKWGLLECVRGTTDGRKEGRVLHSDVHAHARVLPRVLADSPLLSFCKCGICFPALFLSTTAAASRARRISCISEEQFQLESGVGETVETGSNKGGGRGTRRGSIKAVHPKISLPRHIPGAAIAIADRQTPKTLCFHQSRRMEMRIEAERRRGR